MNAECLIQPGETGKHRELGSTHKLGQGSPKCCCCFPGETCENLKQMAASMLVGSSTESSEQPRAGQGALHRAQAVEQEKAAQSKGPPAPQEAISDGRSLLRVSVAIVGLWSCRGVWLRDEKKHRPAVKKQDVFALPLCEMRKGKGKHMLSPPSCRVFTTCGLSESWFPHCSAVAAERGFTQGSALVR